MKINKGTAMRVTFSITPKIFDEINPKSESEKISSQKWPSNPKSRPTPLKTNATGNPESIPINRTGNISRGKNSSILKLIAFNPATVCSSSRLLEELVSCTAGGERMIEERVESFRRGMHI